MVAAANRPRGPRVTRLGAKVVVAMAAKVIRDSLIAIFLVGFGG